MISDTSFVTNIEEKNTAKTRKKESPVIVDILPANLTTGVNMFSFLNPSRTRSIMKRVPKVRQSMSESKAFVGGVIKRAAAAAITDTVSMSSFFKNLNMVFTGLMSYLL